MAVPKFGTQRALVPGGHRLAPTEAVAETAGSNPVASTKSFVYAGFRIPGIRFLMVGLVGADGWPG